MTGIILSQNKSAGKLKGNALEIYRLLLRAEKPLGIREIQRTLNLTSPSIVQWHLRKLEAVELVKRKGTNYSANKVLLENCIRISRFLIPRYLFYFMFAVLILSIELTLFRPVILTREYFFALAATLIFVLIFCYEGVKIWLRHIL